jgi:hypothetical protein
MIVVVHAATATGQPILHCVAFNFALAASFAGFGGTNARLFQVHHNRYLS